MITIINKNLSSAYLGNRSIASIYIGNQLVWPVDQDIQSCFARGYWIDIYPWTDNLPWKD